MINKQGDKMKYLFAIFIFLSMGLTHHNDGLPHTHNQPIQQQSHLPHGNINDLVLTYAMISAAANANSNDNECNPTIIIDRYQLSTTFGVIDNQQYIFETIVDSYTGMIISRNQILAENYK